MQEVAEYAEKHNVSASMESPGSPGECYGDGAFGLISERMLQWTRREVTVNAIAAMQEGAIGNEPRWTHREVPVNARGGGLRGEAQCQCFNGVTGKSR